MTRSIREGNGVVVELCGLPGAGKTTLACELTRLLRQRGIDVRIADLAISAARPLTRRVVRRCMASAAEVSRHPAVTAVTAREIATIGQERQRDTAAGLAQWLTLQRLIRQSHRRPGVAIVEQGVVQTLWSLALRAERNPASRLWECLDEASRPDVVLALDPPLALVLARLCDRESRHSRSQHLSPEELYRELALGWRLLEQLLVCCPVPVLRLPLREADRPETLGFRSAEALQPYLRPAAPLRR